MTIVAPKPEVTSLTDVRIDEAPPRLDEPTARLELLCDPGTFSPVRSAVRSAQLGHRAGPGDGVVAGAGRVGGRPVFCYAQDPRFMGGSLGEAHADTIVRVMRLAEQSGAPVVGFVESGGARLQEGHAALAGYGRIFRASVELSGRVPQISVVTGISAGGGAYSPALTDFVVMTESARMFLTGPKIVQEALGEEVSMEDLGGPGVHSRNGVCQLVAEGEPEAIALTRELLGLLPSRIAAGPAPLTDAEPSPPIDPGSTVPDEARKVYDIRDPARAVVDDGRLLELSENWARNMVTALARIDGRPVGIVANQPRRLGGVIDAQASEKAALFVDACDRFGLPLVVLVDTPGFMPGTGQERAGVIRHGASLLRAFASARVPKLTVILRKAYGGAVITMNSRDLGADLVFAWPGAEIGIMAARQAVGIVHRRRLAEEEDAEAALGDLAAAYADEHLNATAAAGAGFVDEVIEPTETRERLAWALGSLERP
jgi:acetyl-CoA carboxylase carboxyltransferase component